MDEAEYIINKQFTPTGIPDAPPWKQIPITVGSTLKGKISKKETNTIEILNTVLEEMEQRQRNTSIYTDGSKLDTGQTGCAV